MSANPKTTLPDNYCLITITCDQFAIGTEVLLYSVLKYNPWFSGDINIVIGDLSVQNRARLQAIYPVKFIHAGKALIEKVAVLREHFSYLRDIHLRFYSLEAFNQRQYDKVVYLDSDMHCAGDIKALFLSQAPLQACLDGYSYEDKIAPIVARAGLTLPVSSERYGQSFKNSFNAGVITLTPSKLSDQHYQGLLNMLDYDVWVGYGESIFTDQMVINRYFSDQFELLGSQYNYMLFLGEYLTFVDDIEPRQARLIHFAGKIKPWNNYEQQALLDCAPQYLPFIQSWRTLLQEARSKDKSLFQAQKLLQHYRWIEAGADHRLQVTDRLF